MLDLDLLALLEPPAGVDEDLGGGSAPGSGTSMRWKASTKLGSLLCAAANTSGVHSQIRLSSPLSTNGP